jgi:hypothetical protein
MRPNQLSRRKLHWRHRAFWTLIFSFGAAAPAAAHGFAHRYDLPIPLSFYIWGAGASVAFSFVVFALCLRPGHGLVRKHLDLRIDAHVIRLLVAAPRTLASGTLLLVIVAGLFGNQDPVRNIAPVMIWIIGWVGLAFVSVLLGDVWKLVNPWNAIFSFAEACCRRWHVAAMVGFRQPYPQWLAAWPAFLLLISFAWMELVWSGKNDPAALVSALAAYSALTFFGMTLFGREKWLSHGEVFTCVFGTFARFGPLTAMPERAGIRVHMPAAGLLEHLPSTFSMVALVVALLATVTFDGLLETPLWARLDLAAMDWAWKFSFRDVPILREDQAVRLIRSIGLVGCILAFLAVYFVVCWLTAAAANQRTALVLRGFVLTLVPIAIAYHVAHYFSLFFLGGQYLIPLLSDPLGRGWNLFGTAGYKVDIGLVTPWLQWSVAVVAVVLGHVCAIYLSHVTALRLFVDRRAALRSQVPMAALMIVYTMISLWILSQPIVETGVR